MEDYKCDGCANSCDIEYEMEGEDVKFKEEYCFVGRMKAKEALKKTSEQKEQSDN